MHPSARPMPTWARPLLVGLLVLDLLASAGVAIAAPAPGSIPASGSLAVPALVAASATDAAPDLPLTVDTFRMSPSIAGLGMAAAVRPQVIAPAKTEVVVSKPKTTTSVSATATKATTKAAAKTTTKAVVKKAAASYSGVYHLWIPGLGLSRSISDWGCNGGQIPNKVEYWGCVGHNNLYLLGHAWGVFASIHDGYHSGALHVGLTAWYADKSGNVHRYVISQIRHVANKDYATWSTWAMAATSGPVITLQTCDGATSAFRILVRLIPV